jgi:integrase
MEVPETLKCPFCGSSEVVKRGTRLQADGTNGVQRHICNICGRSFTPSSGNRTILYHSSYRRIRRIQDRQVCASAKEVRNLSTPTELKTVAGEEEARLTQFEWKSRKRRLQQSTINLRLRHLRNLVKEGADLNNPESVETVMATRNYPTATAWLVNEAYHSYCKMFGILWEKLRIKYQPKMPYIPTEQDTWLFIGALSGKTISIVCRTLFETGCRIGELHQIERTDVEWENYTITIQHPEKNSNPRALKVSPELIGLLKTLPLNFGNSLFNPTKGAYDASFIRQRIRCADRLGKPQFLKIHFHTFRHARASIDIANGVPLFEVKQNLGHKSILNTEKYIHWNRQLYHEKNDRYFFASVATDEEAGKLIEAGWTHVCNNPSTGRMPFRKAK